VGSSRGQANWRKRPWVLKNSFLQTFAKTKLRQDALQTTFSIFLDIFYPPNLCCSKENGVFQQPRTFTLIASVPTSFRFTEHQRTLAAESRKAG
jgi:hypothetical protein